MGSQQAHAVVIDLKQVDANRILEASAALERATKEINEANFLILNKAESIKRTWGRISKDKANNDSIPVNYQTTTIASLQERVKGLEESLKLLIQKQKIAIATLQAAVQ